MTNDYGNLELHQVLLAAMKDIDRICRENGLRYYLHAGTLLGAMNYKGFIPWDDDVDISMMRDDYEQFLRLMQVQYGSRYFVQTYETDLQHTNNRAVLRVLGTKVSYQHGENAAKHQEIGIDIVPLDAVPDSMLLQKLQQGTIWVLDAAVQIKQGSIKPRHVVMRCIGLLSHMERVKLGRMIDRVTTAFNGSKTDQIGLLSYTGKNPYTHVSGYYNDVMPRVWFEDPIMVEYEDTQMMTISCPEKDLDHRYGPCWMESYPEEKRVTKHDVKAYWISPEVRERVGL